VDKKKVGRPKSRWPDAVNGDAWKIGIILSWIRTLDREVWRKRLLEDKL